MHDLVEWAAVQPWSDGNVGMIGISYFAMSQVEAAVEQPPHLKAIFPVATTSDLYEAALHHGLLNSTFVTPFLSMVGMTSGHGDKLWRGTVVNAARHVLTMPVLHKKFATMNGEASIGIMKAALKLHHDPHPWDDLWRSAAVEHPVRDDWWEERNLVPLLDKVTVPVYLGCDWENVPLHLPSTFPTLAALTSSPNVRVAMLGDFGLTWPWESLHVEALAWFDHWLKGPTPESSTGQPSVTGSPSPMSGGPRDLAAARGHLPRVALNADGSLDPAEREPGAARYLTLGAGLNRTQASPTDPPGHLTWTSNPLDEDLDMAGDIELRLEARSTAADTAWIATLQDVEPDGTAHDVTAGYLRASLRTVDEDASRPGAPVLPCRKAVAVPIGQDVQYRIPLVPNARRFNAGHRIRLHLTSDDQDPKAPAMMGFRHAQSAQAPSTRSVAVPPAAARPPRAGALAAAAHAEART